MGCDTMRELSSFEASLLARMVDDDGLCMNKLDVETRNVIQRMRNDLFVYYKIRNQSEDQSINHVYVFAAPLGIDALNSFDRKCDQDAQAEIQREADALESNHNKLHSLCHDLFVALFGAFLAFAIEHPYHLIQLIQVTLAWPAE